MRALRAEVGQSIRLVADGSPETLEKARARSLKAMSHPLRLKILCTLGDREVSVQDIVDNVGTSQSNISQHLAILRDKGVLQTRNHLTQHRPIATNASLGFATCVLPGRVVPKGADVNIK